MAINGGSRKWFNYLADDGELYAVNRDESNAEATGFAAFTTGTKPLPQGTKPRGINCINAVGQRRFFEIGDPTVDAFTGVDTSISISGDTWFVTSTRGEKSRKPFILDTGLDDGDN